MTNQSVHIGLRRLCLRARTVAGVPDRGSITLFVAVAMVGLLAVIGLIVDGSRAVQATENADAIAQEAARAGGQAVDPAAIAAGGQIAVTPEAATAAAQTYLASAGVTGEVTVIDGETLVVTVTIIQPTIFLGAIGKDSFVLEGHASATLNPR